MDSKQYVRVLEGYAIDAIRASVTIEEMQAEIIDLKTRLALRESALTAWRGDDRRLDDNVQEIQRLTDALGEAERQRDELQGRLEAEATGHCNALGEGSETKDALTKALGTIATLTMRIAELSNALGEAGKEADELRTDVANYDRSLTATMADYRREVNEANRLRTELATANVSLLDLRQRVEIAQGEAKAAMEAKADTAAIYDLVQKQYDRLAREYEELSRSRRSVEGLLSARCEQLTQAEAALATMRQTVKNQFDALVYSKGSQRHQFALGRHAGAKAMFDDVIKLIGDFSQPAVGMPGDLMDLVTFLEERLSVPEKPAIRPNADEPIRSILREAANAYYDQQGILGRAGDCEATPRGRAPLCDCDYCVAQRAKQSEEANGAD